MFTTTIINTPKKIRIGDPMYFRKNTTNCRKYTLSQAFPKHLLTSASITRDKDGDVKVRICLAPDEKRLQLYQEDRYLFNSKTSVEEVELGCDTASFLIEFDGRTDLIHTMADGFYGNATLIKQGGENYGAIIVLFLCEDVFDEHIENSFKYVFGMEVKK